MVQRVAMHTVRRMTKPGKAATANSPAVAPTYEEIKPGTVFDAKDSEVAAFDAAGATVAVTDKRAAKFGFGTEAGKGLVAQEEGETEASADKRRRRASVARSATAPVVQAAAQKTAAAKARESDLVG